MSTISDIVDKITENGWTLVRMDTPTTSSGVIHMGNTVLEEFIGKPEERDELLRKSFSKAVKKDKKLKKRVDDTKILQDSLI